LVRAVNELLLEVAMEARRLHTTTDALEAVFDAPSVIFGHPHDSEGTNEIRDRSGCRVADGRL